MAEGVFPHTYVELIEEQTQHAPHTHSNLWPCVKCVCDRTVDRVRAIRHHWGKRSVVRRLHAAIDSLYQQRRRDRIFEQNSSFRIRMNALES